MSVTAPSINRTFGLLCLAWVAYVFVVNATWWTIEWDHRFLLNAAYCAFNVLVMVATASLMLRRPEEFIVWTRRAILAALVVECVAVAVLLGGGLRTAGTFNNPNQLAYWSLLIASCWMVLKPREPLDLYDIGVIGAAVSLCVAASGSRAGALGAAILVVAAVMFQGVRVRWLPALVLIGIIAATSAGYWTASIGEQCGDTALRSGAKHDTIAGRGYDRIWLFPQYLFVGAGEGAYQRFAGVSAGGGDLEIHSTPAQILFGYGLLGTAVLVTLLWWIFRRADWRHLAYLAPAMVYGLTHNGIRESLLWILLGIVFGTAELRARYAVTAQREDAERAAPPRYADGEDRVLR